MKSPYGCYIRDILKSPDYFIPHFLGKIYTRPIALQIPVSTTRTISHTTNVRVIYAIPVPIVFLNKMPHTLAVIKIERISKIIIKPVDIVFPP